MMIRYYPFQNPGAIENSDIDAVLFSEVRFCSGAIFVRDSLISYKKCARVTSRQCSDLSHVILDLGAPIFFRAERECPIFICRCRMTAPPSISRQLGSNRVGGSIRVAVAATNRPGLR